MKGKLLKKGESYDKIIACILKNLSFNKAEKAVCSKIIIKKKGEGQSILLRHRTDPYLQKKDDYLKG